MTLYDKIIIINEKIGVMYNKLYTLLNNYNVEVNENNTFTELIEKVDKIPGAQYHYINNYKPISNVIINKDSSLLRKEIEIYYKIQYLSDYLQYALLLKGIPKRTINECNNLNELIDLVGLINKIKAPILTLDVNETDYYFNSYITIPYTLLDEDGNNITDGYIIVLEDNIEIARIKVGEDLKFLPSDIGTFNYAIYYEGTDDILPTEMQIYTFNILPPALKLLVTGKNIGESQYKNNAHICYDEDVFQLNIITINPYINARLVNIPFTIIVPQANGNKYYYGVTDLNGEYTINIQSNKIDTFNITIITTYDNKKISNNSTTYNITVYHNPIKIDDYIFIITQPEREMEINCYNNQGQLTNNYYTSSYKIIQKYNNENYHNYNLVNKNNPFIITETHEEVGKYNYIYQLYQGNKLICTTNNNVRLKREINIELIPVDKFIEANTKNISFYIYVTDHLDNPIPNITLRLIDTYHGLRDNTYTTNNEGLITSSINISDILNNPCNGFLLQAIILEEDNEDVCQIQCNEYSNSVYYRIQTDETLDTYINIKTIDSYSLEQLSFTPILTIYDSEGERVLQPISKLYLISSVLIPTNITNNIYDGSYGIINLDTNTYEHLIGDTLTLTAEYDGESGFFNNSIKTKNIIFIKSDVIINTILPSFTVYEEHNFSITLTIPNINSKYITGDVSIILDENEYTTQRNNNIYNASVIPLNAKETQISINYNGNKYTNTNIINYPIIINKTNNYTLSCALSNDEIFILDSITFTPTLLGNTQTQQVFNGTITYTINGENITKDLNPFTYTPVQTGQQTITITYNGDNNHYSQSITKIFLVKKINPTLNLYVPEISPSYRSDINYKLTDISYDGNDEGLTVKVYDNNVEKYNKTNIEHDENIFNITTLGQHTIKLKTDETNIYNSLTLEKNIDIYDFVEEVYKILQDIKGENDYNNQYLLADDIEDILDCLLETDTDYDEDILEGLYQILNHMED